MVGSLFTTNKDIDKATVKAQIPLRKLQREARPFHLSVMDDAVRALSQYCTDVLSGAYPAAKHSIKIKEEEKQKDGGDKEEDETRRGRG